MTIPPGARCDRVLRIYGQCPDPATEAVEEDANIHGFYCGLHAETVRYEMEQPNAIPVTVIGHIHPGLAAGETCAACRAGQR